MLHCKYLKLYTESSNCKQKAICENDFINLETYCTQKNSLCMSKKNRNIMRRSQLLKVSLFSIDAFSDLYVKCV